MTSERETITLTLQPLKDDVPAIHRVRSALKTLLRVYRLKCVKIDWPLPVSTVAQNVPSGSPAAEPITR